MKHDKNFKWKIKSGFAFNVNTADGQHDKKEEKKYLFKKHTF